MPPIGTLEGNAAVVEETAPGRLTMLVIALVIFHIGALVSLILVKIVPEIPARNQLALKFAECANIPL